jgi:phage host-nuclease inhibitor protein Gam
VAEPAVLRAVVEHLALELAEMEEEFVRYREMAQLAIAQIGELQKENQRLRRSREAEAAITGVYRR